jgi:hypothetical protein
MAGAILREEGFVQANHSRKPFRKTILTVGRQANVIAALQ